MRYRIGYDVYRGNALENEDYIADEVLFLRHQSIDIGDRGHDRDENRGWFVVPSVEQVVWLQRHYARDDRYMHITSVAAVIEPQDLVDEVVVIGALLKRVRFVWEALALDEKGKLFVRYGSGDERLAEQIAVLLAYTTRIEPWLLPASADDWQAADKPYRGTLVARGTPDESSSRLKVPARDLPGSASELRQLIESLRHKPSQRVTLFYEEGEYDQAATVATWVREATGASVLPELE